MNTMTKYWTVDPFYDPQNPSIQEAAQLILSGQTVAFPTETVYGLGADARSKEAVERIFQAKGRPSDNPLIVHVAKRSQLDLFVGEVSETASRLIDEFWPGPLTLVLPVKEGTISPNATAGLNTVAVRMPDHPVALSLIEACGCPIAAPSANRSGKPSPTRAEHVLEDLQGLIGGILDAGPTGIGLESTVVELRSRTIHILRPGGIGVEQLQKISSNVSCEESGDRGHQANEAHNPRSPGMKYTHYAPAGEMLVVQGTFPEQVTARMQSEVDKAKRSGAKTGVLTFDEHVSRFHADFIVSLGSKDHLETAASRLYDALRQFDRENVTFIVAEACPQDGIGLAVMNRMLKAAGYRFVQM